MNRLRYAVIVAVSVELLEQQNSFSTFTCKQQCKHKMNNLYTNNTYKQHKQQWTRRKILQVIQVVLVKVAYLLDD